MLLQDPFQWDIPLIINNAQLRWLGDNVHLVQFQLSRVLNCTQDVGDRYSHLWDVHRIIVTSLVICDFKWNNPMTLNL